MEEAVEKLDYQIPDATEERFQHIEEDAGNVEAYPSWREHDPPWKRVKVAPFLWKPKTELCVGAPWRRREVPVPPEVEENQPNPAKMWYNAPPRHRRAGSGRSTRAMKIWNAVICNIKGCDRLRSLLWHGEELVGHHAHCCCVCRQTNGREHAYYCKSYGHVYLNDEGRGYSQFFVKDNGKDAADAAWYQQKWDDRAWGSCSWSSTWQSSWSEGVPDPGAQGAEGEGSAASSDWK